MSGAYNQLHPAVQRALWDMRWKELRQLQVQAIQSFFGSDRSLILSASTASGKTEAAFLPVLSAIADQPVGSIRALYVGPLKALINDQFLRLEDLCRHADIPVHRWHGDVSATEKQKFRNDPGGVLLITPESLESAFINYGTQVPRIFGGLEYVVIDELHSFIADVRGTHLRSLIARLGQVVGRMPRQFGLSATLADFSSARRFLVPEAPESVDIIEDEGGSRSVRIGLRAFPRPIPRNEGASDKPEPRLATTAIEARDVLIAITEGSVATPNDKAQGGDGDTALRNLALDLAGVFGRHTNLIFTNSRAMGEMLADETNQIATEQRWPRNPFVLHHGSLSREVREDVEERLKTGEPLSVFCTSTLEMGIDIGAVNSVGQLGPPWSVSSLVQRLGRSGRREGESAILRFYSLDPPPVQGAVIDDLLCPQLLRSIAIIELMPERWLEPFDNDRFQFSTLIHQILSVLRETGGAKALRLHERLVTKGAFRDIEISHFTSILRSLAAAELIEQVPTGELILAPGGEAVTHGRDFYAAFTGGTDYSVRHEQDDIGKMPADSLPPEGEHLLLNGRRWVVDEIDSRALIVQVKPARSRNKPLFLGFGGTIHRAIIEKMRDVLAGKELPSYLHDDAAALLQAVRLFAKKNQILDLPWLETQTTCIAFPWTGTKGMETLRICAEADGIEVEMKNLMITYICDSEQLQQHLERVANQNFNPVDLAARLRVPNRDKFDEILATDLLNLSNSERSISIKDAGDAATAMFGRKQIKADS